MLATTKRTTAKNFKVLLYAFFSVLSALGQHAEAQTTTLLPTALQTTKTTNSCKQKGHSNGSSGGGGADNGSDGNSMGMWGNVDPNIFYICDPETNRPLQLRCPEGRGFFNGFGYYGCIPYNEWPACIPPDVRHQQDDNSQKVLCDSEHLLQPWETNNPNKFYMCVEAAVEPVLVNCEIGKGFVSAATSGNSKIVGCALWTKWRAYMQCEQYY